MRKRITMNKKQTKIILLATLLVILVGVVSATEVSDDTITTDTTTTTDEVVHQAQTTTESTHGSEAVQPKEIQKEEKKTKTATKTYEVNDFDSLESALTSESYDTVTVNIKSNITLTDTTTLNEAIKTLTINGNGKTIDGQNNYQFLHVDHVDVTLKNLKIINCGGGAIFTIFGDLTVYDCTFNNNTGDYGGAIYGEKVTIYNSTFNNNTGDYGGAIYGDQLTIYNSTFNNNKATNNGGAIDEYTLTIYNSTFNNNTADSGGAIYNHECGTLITYNSTFNNNQANIGGAITDYGGQNFFDVFGTITSYDSTFNNNQANLGGAIYNERNTLDIYNCNFTKNTVNPNGEMIGGDTDDYPMDKGLGGAIYNKATGNINNSIFDENYIDEGQYHRQGGGAIYNNGTLEIENSKLLNNRAFGSAGAVYNENNVTINNCIFNNNYAETNGGALTNIGKTTIDSSQFNENQAFRGSAILNGAGENDVNMKITNSKFNNNNAELGTIYSVNNISITNSTFSNNHGGAIYNNEYGKGIIYTSTFNNNTANIGGAIQNMGDLTIDNSVFNNNTADNGGAIYNHEYGTLTIYNSTFNNNTADYGGAINNNGTLTIYNSTFNNNAENGGAIYNDEYGTLAIYNSTFNNNTADYGGAIYNYGTLTIYNSTFNNNTAENGGAINNNGYGTLTIYNSTFNNNTSDFGGAIFNGYGTLTIYNSTFNNNAGSSGGAICNGGISTIYNSTFNNNTSTVSGGAIDNYETLTIYNSTFNNNKNKADYYGGAINNGYGGKLTIYNSTFNNNAGSSGGAIDNHGTLTIHNSTFNNNTAENGGAINNFAGNNTKIINNNFINNSAKDGAAIYINYDSANVTIKNNTFTTNKANATGKAIIDYGTNTIIKNNTGDDTSIDSSTIYITGVNTLISNNIFDDGRIKTKTTVSTAKGIIGEKLTLKATVVDANNNKVNEGILIFKLNGITIKDNGKLTGSDNPLKVYVKDGVASTTVTADLNMRYAQNLTAVYSGSSTYNASRSNNAKAQISQRNASIIVNSNVKTIKQGQTLTITARVYDTTGGKPSTSLIPYEDEFVYFKVNGITLKDSKGNMQKVKLVNGTATIKYTIPLGLSGVTDGKTFNVKNHTILAGYYNKNYQAEVRNTSTFQVERSNITINIANATVNNKTHKLSLTATIKDYLGNKVLGPNKCVVKVNGVTLKNGTQLIYYYAKDGILGLKDVTIPAYNNYKSIEIVTQDRLSYKSQRYTTNVIRVV